MSDVGLLQKELALPSRQLLPPFDVIFVTGVLTKDPLVVKVRRDPFLLLHSRHDHSCLLLLLLME